MSDVCGNSAGLLTVEFWGPMACFCPPYAKVDRLSYAVPTPSALRGTLASVYCKPAEFWWAIRKIEIMRPIKYLSVRRNEVKRRLSDRGMRPIDVTACRTQRAMTVLKDVRYRVTAQITPADGCRRPLAALTDQAVRRFEKGQCFQQPYLGLRECICDFALSDGLGRPIQESMDLNLMVFDTHVPYDNRKNAPFSSSLYHAVMQDGVILVPDYDSPEVIKLGRGILAGPAEGSDAYVAGTV